MQSNRGYHNIYISHPGNKDRTKGMPSKDLLTLGSTSLDEHNVTIFDDIVLALRSDLTLGLHCLLVTFFP